MTETTDKSQLAADKTADRSQSRPDRTASARTNPAQAESHPRWPRAARSHSPKFQRRRPAVKIEEVDWKNLKGLRYFLADDGTIRSARKSGADARLQRRVVQAIKRARYMALLPYTHTQASETGSRLPRTLPDFRRPGR
jgi:small subunit ribosomal protein S18